MLYHNCALEHGADTYRLAGDDGIEPRGHFVVERGNNAGERNQFCGSTHSNPPKAGAATKSADCNREAPSTRSAGNDVIRSRTTKSAGPKTGAVVSNWGC
jgi:hypothetical protein